jgi:hypothetical protein
MGKRLSVGRRLGVAARIVSVTLLAAVPAFRSPAAQAQAPAAAAAPTPDRQAALTRARSQFQQALSLETAEDWAGALSLFQQVAAIKLTPQVRFHIGLCEDHVGRLASALGDYKLAAVEAQEANATEVAAQVAARLDELRARIPRVVIVRGKGAEYATISLDGVSLGSSSVGNELPVDPGPHNVEAQARGFKPYNQTIQMAEKEVKKVEVVLDAVSAEPAVVLPPPPGPGVETAAAPKKSKVLPYVIGGVGIASLVASGVFFGLKTSANNKLADKCGPDRNQCPNDPSLQSTYNSGKTYNTLVPITLGVGVAAVGTAVVLLLTQKGSAPAPAAASASASIAVEPLLPVAGGSPAGAAISGRF